MVVCEDADALGLTSEGWLLVSAIFIVLSFYLTVPGKLINLVPLKVFSQTLEFFRFVNFAGIIFVAYIFYLDGIDLIDILAIATTWTSILALPTLCY